MQMEKLKLINNSMIYEYKALEKYESQKDHERGC